MAECPKCLGMKTVLVEFDDAKVEVACDVCNGTGSVEGSDVCRTCWGRHTVLVFIKDTPVEIRCPDCHPA